jgi:hypothetical protein
MVCEGEEMKVYCKNCKYLSKDDVGFEICLADGLCNIYGKNIGIKKALVGSFSCKYYRKLWYKFWVKDNK